MNMNRAVLGGLLLVMIENSLVPWLIPDAWSGRLLPHFAFVLTIYAAFFAGRHRAFLYGLGFGLLGDILYYGSLIGPYGFGMGLIGYAAGLLLEQKAPSLSKVIAVMAAGSMLLSSIVYGIYWLFRLTSWSYGFAMYWYMVPSMLLEVLVALALYMPVRRLLLKPPAASAEEPV